MNGFLHRCRVERGGHTLYCVNNIFLRGCECVSVTWVGMKATRAPVSLSRRAMSVFPWRVGLLLMLATLLPLTDAQLGDWETTTLCIHDSSCQLTSICRHLDILFVCLLTLFNSRICQFFVTFPHFECGKGYNTFDPKKIHRFPSRASQFQDCH